MPTPPPPITALPVAPSREDSVNFAARADAFVAALPPFGTEANALASNVYSNALEAEVDATAAAASQAAAAASAAAAFAASNVTLWVSGTTYAIGATVYSPIDFLTYRRKTSGAGTTDPSLDSTNWQLISGIVGTLPPSSGGTGLTSVGTVGNVLTSDGTDWVSLPPSGLPELEVVSGTTQSAVKGKHYVLTNAAATTVTLPSSPSAGDTVYITVANGLTTNVVARNSANIQSIAEDLTLNATYAAVQLRYADATRGWVFI
jgi:hypothetical protein